MLEKRYNPIEQAKKDKQVASLGTFVKYALEVDKIKVGYYEFRGISYIASYSKMKTTDWTIIIKTPIHEFMGTIIILKRSIYIIGFIILFIALGITYFVAIRMVRPISNTVYALREIAQGDGDLTVRLPLKGNDEITDLSLYFNQTIEKIGYSIKIVENNAEKMEEIGGELASNMTGTASSVHEINSNITCVKG